MAKRTKKRNAGGRRLVCPECGEAVWDLPRGSKLAKCWNKEGHASGNTLAFDTLRNPRGRKAKRRRNTRRPAHRAFSTQEQQVMGEVQRGRTAFHPRDVAGLIRRGYLRAVGRPKPKTAEEKRWMPTGFVQVQARGRGLGIGKRQAIAVARKAANPRNRTMRIANPDVAQKVAAALRKMGVKVRLGNPGDVPCVVCGRDTRVYGYNYGACDRCAKDAISRAGKKKRSK